MRARTCIAILVACVIHSGDGGSQWSGGDNVVAAAPAGIQHPLVQRAVWVDEGSNVASPAAGTCNEISAVCADCARNVAVIETLDRCARAGRRIAF